MSSRLGAVSAFLTSTGGVATLGGLAGAGGLGAMATGQYGVEVALIESKKAKADAEFDAATQRLTQRIAGAQKIVTDWESQTGWQRFLTNLGDLWNRTIGRILGGDAETTKSQYERYLEAAQLVNGDASIPRTAAHRQETLRLQHTERINEIDSNAGIEVARKTGETLGYVGESVGPYALGAAAAGGGVYGARRMIKGREAAPSDGGGGRGKRPGGHSRPDGRGRSPDGGPREASRRPRGRRSGRLGTAMRAGAIILAGGTAAFTAFSGGGGASEAHAATAPQDAVLTGGSDPNASDAIVGDAVQTTEMDAPNSTAATIADASGAAALALTTASMVTPGLGGVAAASWAASEISDAYAENGICSVRMGGALAASFGDIVASTAFGGWAGDAWREGVRTVFWAAGADESQMPMGSELGDMVVRPTFAAVTDPESEERSWAVAAWNGITGDSGQTTRVAQAAQPSQGLFTTTAYRPS